MESVPCNLCGSAESQDYLQAKDPLSGGLFHLVKCRNCGLVFTNPRPSRLEMPGHYPEFLYRDDLAVKEKRAIAEKFVSAGRVLDVGCGRGFFLAALGDRFEAVGADVDTKSLSLARTEFGLNVIPGDITDLPLDGESFDLITFWHSLEHLARPKESLLRARHLLKKDGLLIVAVPNIASLQARFFGPNWYHLDVPRHFYHFSPRTLSRLLEEAGFSVVDTSGTLSSHNLHGWWRSPFSALHLRFDFPDKATFQKAVDPRWYLSKFLFLVIWLPARLLAEIESRRARPGTIVYVAKK